MGEITSNCYLLNLENKYILTGLSNRNLYVIPYVINYHLTIVSRTYPKVLTFTTSIRSEFIIVIAFTFHRKSITNIKTSYEKSKHYTALVIMKF